jgi:hypothetical protein
MRQQVPPMKSNSDQEHILVFKRTYSQMIALFRYIDVSLRKIVAIAPDCLDSFFPEGDN